MEGCKTKQESGDCSNLGRNVCNVNDCNWSDGYGCSDAKYCEDIYIKENCKSFSESLDGNPCYIDTDELCKGAISCFNLTYDKSDNNICIENKNNENLDGYCFWDVNECKTVKICSDLTYDGTDGTVCETDHSSGGDGIEGPCFWDESNSINNICRVKVCRDILSDEECIRWSYDDCDWYKTGCDEKRNSEDCEDLGKSICSDGEKCIWESDIEGCRGRKCSEISKKNCVSLSGSALDGPCFIKEDEECRVKVCGDILNDEECKMWSFGKSGSSCVISFNYYYYYYYYYIFSEFLCLITYYFKYFLR
jgi:hypothetical protein